MNRWTTALVAPLIVLGCGSETQHAARGPQTPELPTARHSEPLESTVPGEASAGYAEVLHVLPTPRVPLEQRAVDDSCPMSLRGAAVRVIEEDDVGVLEFDGPQTIVDDLADAVSQQADAYARAAESTGAEPLYDVWQEGNRLVFRPSDPDDLDALRRDLVEHAAVMRQAGYCPIE